MTSSRFAVILAGGSGVRMGAKLPKQFLEISGKPILRHTIERFLDYDAQIRIVVVLPAAFKEYWKNYCSESGFLERYSMVSGGMTRFHSVQNALAVIPDGALVAVHDSVRPFISPEFIGSLFKCAECNGSAVPSLPLTDSIRRLEQDGSSTSLDRSLFVTVQTPQVFRSEILKKAYMQPYSQHFTDDASVVEASGSPVTLCDGVKGNFKITSPEDLIAAREILLRRR